jgi:hypothetical protein
MAEGIGHCMQYEDGLLRDFRADSVAGKNCEVEKHVRISLARK